MATLSILSNFSLPSQGLTVQGKQGAAADALTDELDITVSGTYHLVLGTLATATVRTVFDDDDDVPADWDYLYLWADQDCYIQLVGATGNAVFKVEATVPFWLPGFDAVLAVANTTIITGGSEPSLEDIDSVVIGNYSGTTLNFFFAVID